MVISLLVPNRSWRDYQGYFQLALKRYTINIIRIARAMTELWSLKVCGVSYYSVSCIRDHRVSMWRLCLFQWSLWGHWHLAPLATSLYCANNHSNFLKEITSTQRANSASNFKPSNFIKLSPADTFKTFQLASLQYKTG